MFKHSGLATVATAVTLASTAVAQVVVPQYTYYPEGGNAIQVTLAATTALNANISTLFYADAAGQQIVAAGTHQRP